MLDSENPLITVDWTNISDANPSITFFGHGVVWRMTELLQKNPPKTKTKNGEVIPRLAVFTAEDVNHRIARFIVEIRAPNGDFNPQNLCSCLLLGIYDACVSKETPKTMNEKDCDFLRARKTLNAQRKGLAAKCKWSF